jgi:(1->4)-alpha-D-glucan 1-alpha-D-glucosylmutase
MNIGQDWRDTALEIPIGKWRNELTGAEVQGGSREIGALLEEFPVALWVKQ